MSWRTVVITNRCKLDLSMGYMVVRGEETKRVFLKEIAILMLENPQISMTGALLSALCKNDTRIIFCDEKRSPYGELQPYYGSHDCSLKLRNQIKWSDKQKGLVWTKIVAEKIRNQSHFLKEKGFVEESCLLDAYIEDMEFRDESNREGHAAKVYFNALFGMKFQRTKESVLNAALNYGYSLILSAINREITASGYATQLGLFHRNQYNAYNFSSDLIEPLRILVDRKVVDMDTGGLIFSKEHKRELLELLSQTVKIDGKNQLLLNAITIYCKSVFNALNENNASLIKFVEI